MSDVKERADYTVESNVVYLQGVLNFETILPMIAPLQKILMSSNLNVIDLQRVTYSNSAGIALLLEMVRVAKKQQQTMAIKSAPQSLRELMKMCGLDVVLQPAA